MSSLGELEEGMPIVGEEPIRAWRAWRLSGGDLISANGMPWPYRRRMEADCIGERSLAEEHEAPLRACTCGIYAATTHANLCAAGYDPAGWKAWGVVKLWGHIVPHERGWRAQYAYPELVIVREPIAARLVERNYGCEVWLREDAVAKPGHADAPPGVAPSIIEAALSYGLHCQVALQLYGSGSYGNYQGPLDPIALGRWFAGLIATEAEQLTRQGAVGNQYSQLQLRFWKVNP